VTLGGYSAGGAGNAKQLNHPTVARIPAGGLVERSAVLDLAAQPSLALLLAEPDFTSASAVAAAINQEFGRPLAAAADGRRIEINVKDRGAENLPAMLARIEQLRVTVAHPARVVVNERTGTIVMGRDVRLGPVSILHGGLSIEISTTFSVSQPPALSGGETARIAQPEVRTGEKAVRRIELGDGATVEQLVSGLQAMGATARDVIAILQAIKAAGALEAELEVL
jgi:flagellar P-ring protein precursor FlgI